MNSASVPRERINGRVSFWYDSFGIPQPSNVLGGDITADVCIVGAGYTGLWTAYYLLKNQPDLNVVLIEKEFAGYGASGRNGGWLTNTITGGRDGYVKTHGHAAVELFQQAMNLTVQEVIDIAAQEGIDADIHKGGELNVATSPAQRERLLAWAKDEQNWASADTQLWEAEQTAQQVNIAGVLGGLWHPHCARIQPAKLARGLAGSVKKLGAAIHEGTQALELGPGKVRTDKGTVSAKYVIRATEGFTANLPGAHRQWLPLNSSMIVTDPLTPAMWEEIGWRDAQTIADMAHAYIYAQRTADGRIALGGRGEPYMYGSRTDVDGHTPEKTVQQLSAMINKLFPATEGIGIDHAWSGVLGVPRDWRATVGLDHDGVGWAGGYVGTGVSTTNLAGRTLADLILGKETHITTLPWVGRRVRQWEIEPLRWLAVKGMYATYNFADASENSGRRSTHPLAHAADWISGKG